MSNAFESTLGQFLVVDTGNILIANWPLSDFLHITKYARDNQCKFGRHLLCGNRNHVAGEAIHIIWLLSYEKCVLPL